MKSPKNFSSTILLSFLPLSNVYPFFILFNSKLKVETETYQIKNNLIFVSLLFFVHNQKKNNKYCKIDYLSIVVRTCSLKDLLKQKWRSLNKLIFLSTLECFWILLNSQCRNSKYNVEVLNRYQKEKLDRKTHRFIKIKSLL